MRLVAPVVVEFYGGGGCSLPVNIRFVSRNIKTNLKKKKHTWSNETHLHLVAPVVVAGI